MTTSTSSALDEAFDRMAAGSGFELPNGFVNHGPMACEALDALGCDDLIDDWARRFSRAPERAVTPVPSPALDWRGSLGDYRLLPEWIGHMHAAIEDDGWQEVVRTWVPRLMPALSTRLFHGAIRTGHAVRALTVADTAPRRAELARALGYWAARYQPGEAVGRAALDAVEPIDDDLRAVVTTEAAGGARRYLTEPNIFNLHGVTGAMAVELIIDHLPTTAGVAAVAQIRAEHAALYGDLRPQTEIRLLDKADTELATQAAASGDVHAVKLVEACRRGFALSGDPAFRAAAETVVQRG